MGRRKLGRVWEGNVPGSSLRIGEKTGTAGQPGSVHHYSQSSPETWRDFSGRGESKPERGVAQPNRKGGTGGGVKGVTGGMREEGFKHKVRKKTNNSTGRVQGILCATLSKGEEEGRGYRAGDLAKMAGGGVSPIEGEEI